MGFNWWRESESEGPSVQEIVDRVQAEWRAERRRIEALGSRSGDIELWSHEAPNQPPSVSEAHAIMQQHRGCRAQDCRRKSAARRVLIDAGRMRPDTSRER